jgi:hypothetical protein
MQEELRKLAAELRKEADEHEKRKMVKCAELIRGSVGLTLLKRKLGRK